jgi:uncharacterized membrane protein
MNRQEYLSALEKALTAAGVRDNAEIIEEYAEHFKRKSADGYSEEETAARLAPPEEIAEQFSEIGTGETTGKSGRSGRSGSITRVFSTIAVVFLDIMIAPIFIMLYAWTFTFGVFTATCALTGALCILVGHSLSIGDALVLQIPQMPYISAVLAGITMLALMLISAVGTEYCRLYVSQMLKKYARWHNNVLSNKGISPPLPLHPWITAKKSRIMRTITLISLVVFVIALVAGLASMMIAARSVEPWHVWHWFE